MTVYIAVGAVLLLGLVLAYRVLGGSAGGTVDSELLVRSAAASLSDVVSVASHDEPRRLRRRVDLAQQQLEEADAASLSPSEAEAHALLMAAAGELHWALRMLESPSSAVTGIQDAAAMLISDAGRCTARAAQQLALSDATEPVDGPAQPLAE
ncbi:MAG: hypothetical protein JOY68_01730 [Candidatus Dormibacteraeota bacterium]|nr:hypothetical protein [Candidatus Dormibacteraeota bacterium]MBV8446152.1 hypothetical protein [Candidatus Dormibacteraeota bacterium]